VNTIAHCRCSGDNPQMMVFAALRRWWWVLCLWAWPAFAWAAFAQSASPLPAQSAALRKDMDLLPAVALSMAHANTLRDAVVTPGSDSPPGIDSAWMRVSLPHRWAVTHGSYEGSMWYRFRVTLPDIPGQPWAVYMPRVNMNGQVWVNGVPMAFEGSLSEPVSRNWYTPQLVRVPPGTWKVGENDIRIHVVSGYISRNGLAAVDVGPVGALEPAYNWRRLMQNDGPRIANTSLVALGLFMVLVWLRDRTQGAIALQGTAAILWGMGNMASAAPEPFLSLFVWESLSFICVVTSQLLICLFFWRFVGRRVRAIDYSIYALLALTPIVTFFWPTGWQIILTYLANLILMAISSTQALIHVVRTRRPDGMVLVAGCLLAVPVAVHDFAFEANWLPYDSFFWLAFAGPVLMYCTFYILAGDHARSRQDLAHLNATLAAQVTEREEALRESFQRLAELERAQAVQAERSRILRDMHDGVGAHLSSALRQLQSPRSQPVDLGLVVQTLRDSLDQLKLSVDALTPGAR
jgi:signal transduction histidine kinase